MDKTICSFCRKGFYYEVFEGGMTYLGIKEDEPILCPYCKAENGSIRTKGFVHTYMIDDNNNPIKNSKH